VGEGDKRCAYIITLPLSVHEEDALQEGAEQVARVIPTLSSSTKSLWSPINPSLAPSHTQLSSSVLRVLSCGAEWRGAESGHGSNQVGCFLFIGGCRCDI
jgi:hypothetical protein